MSILKRMSRIFAASLALLAISSGLSAAQTQAQAQAQGRPLEQTYRAILPQKVETGDHIEVIDFFWYG